MVLGVIGDWIRDKLFMAEACAYLATRPPTEVAFNAEREQHEYALQRLLYNQVTSAADNPAIMRDLKNYLKTYPQSSPRVNVREAFFLAASMLPHKSILCFTEEDITRFSNMSLSGFPKILPLVAQMAVGRGIRLNGVIDNKCKLGSKTVEIKNVDHAYSQCSPQRHAHAMAQIGLEYFEKNEMSPAEFWYRCAFDCNPTDARFPFVLAQIAVEQGQIETAIEALEECMKLSGGKDTTLWEQASKAHESLSGSKTTP